MKLKLASLVVLMSITFYFDYFTHIFRDPAYRPGSITRYFHSYDR